MQTVCLVDKQTQTTFKVRSVHGKLRNLKFHIIFDSTNNSLLDNLKMNTNETFAFLSTPGSNFIFDTGFI